MASRRIALLLSVLVASTVLGACSAQGEAEAPECGAVRRAFVHSAEAVWWSGDVPSPEAVTADLDAAARLASGDEQAELRRLAELVAEIGIDPSEVAPRPQRFEAAELWATLTPWAASVCRPPVPSWACDYGAIGTEYEAVDQADGPDRPPVSNLDPEATTTVPAVSGDPEEIVASVRIPGDPVAISRTDTRATYGWSGADGLITQRAELTVRDGRWVHLSTSRCLDPATQVGP